ncbi:MAG: hypothetical protein L0228_12095 [Planctomycetes bacterium]|nr:hypothetical protein [Planctomycetota bacterium]
MHHTVHKTLACTIFIVFVGWFTLSASGQSPEANSAQHDPSAIDEQELARRKILDSDRWRQTNREFNEWLSVQQVYNPDEVAAIKSSFAQRIAKMSPRELEDFLKDMESRLEVLMSPEADDARQWLAQFMAVAVNPEQQLGRARPDVLNMTASQIRQELQWLQQTRAARQQSQAAFSQARAAQAQAARDVRATRQQTPERSRDRSAWPANNPRRPSQYAPQAELRPAPLSIYTVSPWGHPIYWDPLRNQW